MVQIHSPRPNKPTTINEIQRRPAGRGKPQMVAGANYFRLSTCATLRDVENSADRWGALRAGSECPAGRFLRMYNNLQKDSDESLSQMVAPKMPPEDGQTLSRYRLFEKLRPFARVCCQ